MKKTIPGLSPRYVTALRKYLRGGPRADLQPALRLGHRAVACGLETLELARIHEQALGTLELSGRKDPRLKRAEAFFSEVLIPIVETHRAARQSKLDFKRLNHTLGRCTLALAATHRQLHKGVVRRKHMESAFEQIDKRNNQSLKESLQLQKLLRQLTHRALAAQEDERKTISHELQDEIAQTLLGINVRLLTLKQNARHDTASLKNEIASAQRLVVKSAQSVRRFARELDTHPQAPNDPSVVNI